MNYSPRNLLKDIQNTLYPKNIYHASGKLKSLLDIKNSNDIQYTTDSFGDCIVSMPDELVEIFMKQHKHGVKLIRAELKENFYTEKYGENYKEIIEAKWSKRKIQKSIPVNENTKKRVM